jgi:hypothetical protein
MFAEKSPFKKIFFILYGIYLSYIIIRYWEVALPIMAIALILFYFAVVIPQRRFRFSNDMFLHVSGAIINFNPAYLLNVPHNKRDLVIMFVYQHLHRFEKNLRESYSLETDYYTLAQIRKKIMAFREYDDIFNLLANMCVNIETSIQRKYLFFRLLNYFYQRKQLKKFKQQISLTLNME